ncbi:hypothetical protein O1R50_26055 [Glycomyces luteolus]|uniref:Uncharacterized protein n=1 Tax=Glycomyces luteolus TaxID=2670330 RepID=A0A9X3SU62_9ACTN|nr:hypothetical protein [Glycomyces luteolus]MDA1363104.1 hypothetical protein [Glycomyces luteolus]
MAKHLAELQKPIVDLAKTRLDRPCASCRTLDPNAIEGIGQLSSLVNRTSNISLRMLGGLDAGSDAATRSSIEAKGSAPSMP